MLGQYVLLTRPEYYTIYQRVVLFVLFSEIQSHPCTYRLGRILLVNLPTKGASTNVTEVKLMSESMSDYAAVAC